MVKRLSNVDNALLLLSPDVTEFTNRNMAKRIILCNLSMNARIEYMVLGGEQLRDRTDIFLSCQRLQRIIGLRAEGKNERNQGQAMDKNQASEAKM